MNTIVMNQTSGVTAYRGFVTLSESLGLAANYTYAALVQAVERDANVAVQGAALHALGVFLLGAPFARLPADLLPRSVQVGNSLPWSPLNDLT